MRIIIDTNLWISFLITKRLVKLDTLFLRDDVVLLFSEELLAELIEVAQRPKFSKYFSPTDLNKLLDLLTEMSEIIEVQSSVDICRDVEDNFLLALAKDGRANYLITGDQNLLTIKQFGQTQIVTISELLAELP